MFAGLLEVGFWKLSFLSNRKASGFEQLGRAQRCVFPPYDCLSQMGPEVRLETQLLA